MESRGLLAGGLAGRHWRRMDPFFLACCRRLHHCRSRRIERAHASSKAPLWIPPLLHTLLHFFCFRHLASRSEAGCHLRFRFLFSARCRMDRWSRDPLTLNPIRRYESLNAVLWCLWIVQQGTLSTTTPVSTFPSFAAGEKIPSDLFLSVFFS